MLTLRVEVHGGASEGAYISCISFKQPPMIQFPSIIELIDHIHKTYGICSRLENSFVVKKVIKENKQTTNITYSCFIIKDDAILNEDELKRELSIITTTERI